MPAMSNLSGMKPGDLELSDDEWSAIAPTLPSAPQDARRVSDRLVIAALLAAEASQLSLETIAPSFRLAAPTLRTRRARWAADGTLPQLIDAGGPAIRR